MKALCLLPEVSRPGGVATSKLPLWLVLSDAAAVGLTGTQRGCQWCDEWMAKDCANQPATHTGLEVFFYQFVVGAVSVPVIFLTNFGETLLKPSE